jgi:hypothetical protein
MLVGVDETTWYIRRAPRDVVFSIPVFHDCLGIPPTLLEPATAIDVLEMHLERPPYEHMIAAEFAMTPLEQSAWALTPQLAAQELQQLEGRGMSADEPARIILFDDDGDAAMPGVAMPGVIRHEVSAPVPLNELRRHHAAPPGGAGDEAIAPLPVAHPIMLRHTAGASW